MSDFEGHGWAVVPARYKAQDNHSGLQRASLHIGTLPGRKSVCLYGHNGTPGTIQVYAYFRDEERAYEALSILDQITAALQP